jgi:hypothetical protein
VPLTTALFLFQATHQQNHLVTRKNHLLVKDACFVYRDGSRMKRSESEKVLFDEIVRMRAQLALLQLVLASRTEERKSRMGQCEECDHLWKEYQRATTQSARLYEKIRSMTEDRGLRKLRETTTKAEAAERAFEKARQDWQNIRQQPGIGKSSEWQSPPTRLSLS